MTMSDWPTPQTPSLVQKSGTCLKCEVSYGENLLIFVTTAIEVGLTQISLA